MRNLWQQWLDTQEISSIDRYIPRKRTLSRVSVIIGVVGAIVFAYTYGVGYYAQDRLNMRNYQDQLESTLEKRDWKIKQLKRAVAEIKIVNDIRNSSIKDLKFEISNLQNQIDIRDRDLQFYRSILDPNNAKVVVAQSFSIHPPLLSGQTYRFRIVATQSGIKQRWVQGKLSFRLYGSFNGQQVKYGYRDLKTPRSYDLKFKYFQYIDGKMFLPKGFVVKSATVTINVNGRKPIQQSLEINMEENI